MMAKKLGHEEISTEINTFLAVTAEHFGDYASRAGAM